MKKQKHNLIVTLIAAGVLLIFVGGIGLYQFFANKIASSENALYAQYFALEPTLDERDLLARDVLAFVNARLTSENELTVVLNDNVNIAQVSVTLYDRIEAENRISEAFASFQTAAEADKKIRTNKTYLALRTRIEESNTALFESMAAYNASCDAYNVMIQQFPYSLFGKQALPVLVDPLTLMPAQETENAAPTEK